MTWLGSGGQRSQQAQVCGGEDIHVHAGCQSPCSSDICCQQKCHTQSDHVLESTQVSLDGGCEKFQSVVRESMHSEQVEEKNELADFG